jgi:CheY-like chemotaxis protein
VLQKVVAKKRASRNCAKLFAISAVLRQALRMTKPLALLIHQNLIPGSQLATRFEELGYRVQTLSNAQSLAEQAQKGKPLVVVADLEANKANVCEAIKVLRDGPETKHIPVIAYSRDRSNELQTAAHAAGASLVVKDTTVVAHLPQFLEQALEVE